MIEIDSAMRSASIQKLVAERAYELWENHGRPHGYDAIHWRTAEQEIMECLKRTQTNNPTAAAV